MKKKLTMLVVDDVEVNRALLRVTFQSEYEVMEAWDGQDAMQMLRKNKIDFVILDIYMPNLDGAGVLRQMKADSDLKHIPVVIKTAIDEETEKAMLELGADDFIFFPCDPAIIKNRVDNIVRKYILEREVMQKQIEEEKHLSRVRKNFIAGISYELRNPLDEILRLVDSSQAFDHGNIQVQEAFLRIKDQTEYLKSLANDILDMSAMGHGKMAIHAVPFQLNKVVAVISEEFYGKCREKGIGFTFDVENVLHEALIGDPLRVRQIWTNLLEIAYRCNASGGWIRTSLTEHVCNDRQIELVIVVEDSGSGVTPQMMENIWGPYEQKWEDEISQCSGSELGLAMIRGIVELMRGTIQMESSVDRGTVFTVKLPFDLGNEMIASQKKFNSMKAMIIDDDEIARNYHAVILTRLGIQCTAADSVEYALNQLWESYEKGNGYDICFVNWSMKEETGASIVMKIRKMFDGDTMLLVCASNESGFCDEEMHKRGVDYVLTKPLFQSSIYNLMTDICREGKKREGNLKGDYDFSGKRVLVVEDNAINAAALIGYLREVKMQCDWVRNGKKAVEQFIKAGKQYYNAILMDINMPILDGHQATVEIRKCEENTEDKIPVIAVTANTFSEDIVKAYEAGMNAYVSKPIDTEILYRTVNAYL